jgi:hypothetical protein
MKRTPPFVTLRARAMCTLCGIAGAGNSASPSGASASDFIYRYLSLAINMIAGRRVARRASG